MPSTGKSNGALAADPPTNTYHFKFVRQSPDSTTQIACGEIACGEIACGEIACGERQTNTPGGLYTIGAPGSSSIILLFYLLEILQLMTI